MEAKQLDDGISRHDMTADVARALARVIEITVIGQVDDRRPVGPRPMVDAQLIGRA